MISPKFAAHKLAKMGKPKRMHQIINVLKTYEETGSIKGTARRCNVSKNTVRGYLKLAAAHDADLSVVLKLPTEELRQVLYPDKVRPMVDRKVVFDGKAENPFCVPKQRHKKLSGSRKI